jgi:hypothetical protein
LFLLDKLYSQQISRFLTLCTTSHQQLATKKLTAECCQRGLLKVQSFSNPLAKLLSD